MQSEDRKIAERLLALEEEKAKLNFPAPEGIFLLWNGETYIGSLQKIAEKFSPEIVLLSKTSNLIKPEIVNAILEIQPKRLRIIADNILDLTGRIHILRKVELRLTVCTPEQTKYIMENPPYIREIN